MDILVFQQTGKRRIIMKNTAAKKLVSILLMAGMMFPASSAASARDADNPPAGTLGYSKDYTVTLTLSRWEKVFSSSKFRPVEGKVTISLTDDASSGDSPVMFCIHTGSKIWNHTLSENESVDIMVKPNEDLTVYAKFQKAGDNGDVGITVQFPKA